ncbi:hypothetical protein PGT21_018100 [Puccinia graminis f. sp. tritici]|uniref:Uncharacterized protein n=1 Tax=Puccinia graminis f. sp. tritici TaxID=56615 RepID=A0A5B0Q344_PUCGR|nr:hypothetical protein PGT21_018100 [Puccinia graminis f. sp. tritici]
MDPAEGFPSAGRGTCTSSKRKAFLPMDEWLKAADNYARWRCGDDKDALYRELLAEFISHGITHRKRCETNLRICSLQMSYNAGRNFLMANAVEPLDDPWVKDELMRICPHFHELDAFMEVGQCPPSAQQITN